MIPDDKDNEEMSEEERAAAAEWEAMAGGDGDAAPAEGEPQAAGGGGPKSNRVLDQDEIDSLLGFDAGGGGEDDKPSGIQAIINSALVSYERLPMLEIVFDRLVRMISTSLRNFTSDNVEVSLDSITAIRFGDYLNSIPLPAMLGVFKAEEWDNFGLLMVDSALIYSIVDVLLGGRRGTAAMRIEGRPYTTIERNLVERLIGVVLNDLTADLRSAVAGHLPLRAAGDQPALRRHRAPGQRRRAGAPARRHGRSRRPARAAAALRDPGAGARTAAADVHGREVRPRFDLGNPSCRRALADRGSDRRGARRIQHVAGPGAELGAGLAAGARMHAEFAGRAALRRACNCSAATWAVAAATSRSRSRTG